MSEILLTNDDIRLMETMLEAMSTFLDEEEKRGFLEQDFVNEITNVESKLQQRIVSETNRTRNEQSKKENEKAIYLYNADNSGCDAHFKRRNNEPEL